MIYKGNLIEQIQQQDLDPDGNTDNFWVLVDKINELVIKVNQLSTGGHQDIKVYSQVSIPRKGNK